MNTIVSKSKLPADWEVVRLGKIARIQTGEKDVNEGNPSGAYPFFTCSKEITYSDTYSFDTEAILIAGNGEVGDTKYYNGKFEAYQRTYVLDKFIKNTRYLYYFIAGQIKRKLALAKSGSTMPYIRKGDLQNFEVLMPLDKAEQQNIVYVLDTIQGAIGVQEKLIEKTNELKRAMMAKLFREGTQRKSKFKNQNSKLRLKIKNLSVIADIKYGRAKPKTTGDIPIIGSGGVYAYTDKPLVQKPTIVIGRKGTAGMVHLMLKPCWPSDTTFYLDLDLDLVDPKYLYEFLNMQIISGEEAKTTLPSLKRETLESIGVILPSLDEQREIAEILQTIDQKIEIEQKKKALYEELFRAMLEKLMTAEIRVKDIEFE